MGASREPLRGLQVTKWMAKARCAEVDPDLFHPDQQRPTANAAKRVCARCEVISECLSWAIANPEIGGVLGGMTERERQQLRSRRRAEVMA